MKISKNKFRLLVQTTALLIAGLVLVFILSLSQSNINNSGEPSSANSAQATIDGSVQYVDVKAKVGYSPTEISAKAGVETILRMNTQSTFDCGTAFTIPQLGVYKQLPATGTTEFKLGVRTKGEEIVGTCTMGMYVFTIKFV